MRVELHTSRSFVKRTKKRYNKVRNKIDLNKCRVVDLRVSHNREYIMSILYCPKYNLFIEKNTNTLVGTSLVRLALVADVDLEDGCNSRYKLYLDNKKFTPYVCTMDMIYPELREVV